MANTFLKVGQIARQAIGLLAREVRLPGLFWMDAVGGDDFKGALNDTVSIRVPSYTSARTRTMRSGTALVADDLGETKVDITLDTHLYQLLNIKDEELTLDIADFGAQVTQPAIQAVARGLEDAVVSELQGITFPAARTIEVDNTDPFDSFVDAVTALDNGRVPSAGRFAVVGSQIKARLLKSDQFVNADKAGDNLAFRQGRIGQVAGIDVFDSSALLPTEGYVAHRTALALATATPANPRGATDSATASMPVGEGRSLSIRVLFDYDPTYAQDRQLVDLFMGTGVVTDAGYYDANGRFTPFTGTIANVTLTTSAAADDIIDTTTAHGYAAGDRVVFSSLTGGAGLSTNQAYYVIAANLGAQTFQVSTTAGGSAVNFTTDITAGTVARNGSAANVVRVVKLTDNS
jgi:hypothetical protein